MESREFCELQKAAGLKNSDVQRICAVSDQTVVNWRRGHTRIPGSAAVLIRQLATAHRASSARRGGDYAVPEGRP